MRVLLPLPVTISTSPAPGNGTSRRLRPSASEMRRPEPYKSAMTAASRAQIQGSRASPARSPASAKRFAATIGTGFGRLLADFWRADRGQGPNLALAFPFEEAAERAQARQRPHQGTPANIVAAPHRHEGPDIAGLKRGKARKRHPRAPMRGKEGEALAEIAA